LLVVAVVVAVVFSVIVLVIAVVMVSGKMRCVYRLHFDEVAGHFLSVCSSLPLYVCVCV